MSYVKEELSKLGGSAKVRFSSESGETKWLDLNKETATEIVDHLRKEFNIPLATYGDK